MILREDLVERLLGSWVRWQMTKLMFQQGRVLFQRDLAPTSVPKKLARAVLLRERQRKVLGGDKVGRDDVWVGVPTDVSEIKHDGWVYG